jgi:predicted phage tail protein
MNTLIESRLDGEIIAPDAMVSVFGTTHPLNAVGGARIALRVRAGLSIAEILREALKDRPGHDASASWIVTLGDGNAAHDIPQAHWHRIRVKPGTTVTFQPRLGGGAARIILQAALVVAAIVLAAPTGGASLALAGAIGVSAGVASALITAGIMLAGTLAINALFPIRPPASQDTGSKQLNSIQGAQNQANPGGPIPVVLGNHRQSPYYAAKPYTDDLRRRPVPAARVLHGLRAALNVELSDRRDATDLVFGLRDRDQGGLSRRSAADVLSRPGRRNRAADHAGAGRLEHADHSGSDR